MDIDRIVKEVLERLGAEGANQDTGIPVGVSNRHLHLSKTDLVALFGEGYELQQLKMLSQPGQFACKECVTLVGPRGIIENVRILGPARGQTQIELLQADCRKLGIAPVLRESGKIEGTPGITLCGPKGCVKVETGAIVAKRHIHMSPKDAECFGCSHGEVVGIRIGGERGGVLENVIVRVNPAYILDCHLDVEEANALGLKDGDKVTIIKKGG